MRKHFRITTYIYGLDNLPKEDGFVVYANHQSKYDALCIFEAMQRHSSVLWESGPASRILARQVVGLIDAVPIELDNPRQIVSAINQSIQLVQEGHNIMIFPEGGYDDNRNTLQDFNTGCFSVSLKSHSPISIAVLYDAYKAMNTNKLGKAEVQIHFLPSIAYDEYKDLKKAELATLIKGRIEEKLVELRAQEADYGNNRNAYLKKLEETADRILKK